ncbi:hypothetical protein [Rickettsiella endosymbiont of Rhagonycha lignosa]|uniref:hypothetical protein n=1 Tax=Rickettsiella endosymbiont of Rhagonycha lignosa TaxID=3077937 RepID=UPI00313D6D3E
MMMDNQDSSFVFLHEEEVNQSKHEALRHIRFGNNSLDKQFERDIELMSLAIVQSGPSEQDKIKADILLKSMLLLFFGRVCYRHVSDQRFYPFNTLNAYFKQSKLMHFPIAAILLHGSRALIEFPSEIAPALINWLIIDKSSWRYLATHGISALTEAEGIAKNYPEKQPKFPLRKYLKEQKVSSTHAAINLLSNSISGLNTYFNLTSTAHLQNKMDSAEHFGINLALGGVGNQHFASKHIIQNNGENGHLYINVYQGLTQQSGLLLGIEQSAPGKPDQYGGKHDLSVTDKAYSASGGDFFCKNPVLPEIYQKDYRGLTLLPFANYYDNFWNFVTEDAFALIKSNFEKCKCLLILLTQEKSLAFIKEILTAVGGASQKDFNILFASYFQEIPQIKIKIKQSNALDQLKTLQQQIQLLKIEKQRLESNAKADLLSMKAEIQLIKNTIKNQPYKEFTILREQLQILAIKKNKFEKNNQELFNELIIQREQTLQLQNDKQTLLLANQTHRFMHAVINQMGWFANISQKKKILQALQEKMQAHQINTEQLKYLLINFISVSLINRFYSNTETHTAKACLSYLNDPEYQSLAGFFEMGYPIQYKDLLDLVSKNRYKFYQKESSREYQFDENNFRLATQQVMF